MKKYFNGNKIQMGFALSAYLDEPQNDNKTSNNDDLQPAIKFKKMDKCNAYGLNNYGGEGCDAFECEVSKNDSVNIYVDGNLVYGPVEGGRTIMIL